ncbi:hypothetical protein D3C76_1830750 [compost metagenome]
MLHLGEVTHATQQTVGNTRRSARTASNFQRALLAHLQPHITRTAPYNMLKIGNLIKLQSLHDTKTVTQRRG